MRECKMKYFEVELEEYDEQLVRRLIEKVTVFHDKFAVEFKSGVEIDVEG
ncbi:TPA: integrase [Streptococcus suis]|nr:integrase [Streptococcus suis]HEL2552089.1 integrase [Streptococcus suis]